MNRKEKTLGRALNVAAWCADGRDSVRHKAETLAAIAEQIRAEALEEAAKACAEVAKTHPPKSPYDDYSNGHEDAAIECADRIRALKETP